MQKNKGDFGRKELREGFGLVWSSEKKKWVPEGTTKDSFGTAHETHYHQCLSRAKQEDQSGFFHPCKPLGGMHEEDYKFPFLPLLTMQAPMLAGSYLAGKYTMIGLAGGKTEGAVALGELLIDAWLSQKADKQDSTRKAENMVTYKTLNDEIAAHRAAMLNKMRKGTITKAEVKLTTQRILALEQQRKQYDQAVHDILYEFKDDPDLLAVKTKFEKGIDNKKEEKNIRIVTMIAIIVIIILIFRLLWAVLRR